MGYVPSRSSVLVIVALTGALLLGIASGSPPAGARALDSVQRLGSGNGLRWPTQLRTTSDGSMVFVLNEDQGPQGPVTTNGLASFRVQGDGAPVLADLLHANTGALLDAQDGVNLSISPDDRTLYLGAMKRDPDSGSLIPDIPVIAVLAIRSNGELGYRSLVDLDAVGELDATNLRPSTPVPSPDGRRLYVIVGGGSFKPSLLEVFERDLGSGDLRLLQEFPIAEFLGLEPRSVFGDLAIAPDGENLYLRASPSGSEELASSVFTLDLSPETGRITGGHPLPTDSVVPELRRLRRFLPTDDPSRVFASIDPEEVSDGGLRNRLLVFERDFPSGDLLAPRVLLGPEQHPTPEQFSGVERGPVLSPDSLYAYQCLNELTLQVYRIDVAFEKLEPVQTLELSPVSISGPRCAHPTLTADGHWLFLGDAVPARGNGSLTSLQRDPASGKVTLAGIAVDRGADRLLSVVVSPDGGQVYAIRDDGDVLTFRRDAKRSGRLELLPEQTIGLGVHAGPSEVAAVVAPDGRHLYVGFQDELVTLAREPTSGALRLLRRAPTMGRSLILSGDGRFAYAKSSASEITAYRRDAGSGTLTPVQTLALPASGDTLPGGLAFGPAGATLYVTSSDDSATGRIVTLDRNPSTGRLAVTDEIQLTRFGTTESLVVRRLAVAPDGREAYVVLEQDPFIKPIFSTLRRLIRSPENGSLSPDPNAPENFEEEAFTFLLAPNGRTLYDLVNDRYRGYDAIRPYLREPGSGRLERHRLVELQLGVFDELTVSPDGANLYAVGDEGIWVFANRWFESAEIPGFRFQVSIDPGTGRALRGERVDPCLADTACAQGAVPGRTEALLRIVGPKPNGRLWPTLVKFSTSPIDVMIDQMATDEIKSYHLAGATPGSGELPGLFDRGGFAPTPGASEIHWIEPVPDREDAGDPPPPPPSAPVLTSAAFPDFRFQVRLTNGGGEGLPVRKEAECFDETLCVSGSVPGRSELFLRIVGPKPNGRLWPTLVRTTTSTAEIWIEQVSTGQTNYYRLEGASPGSDDLTGLFDRDGFAP